MCLGQKLCVALLSLCTAISASGQAKKSGMDWSQQDAKKLLTESSWCKTQTDIDTSRMMFRPGAGGSNQAAGVNYRIMLLSSKPVRQALARLVQLDKHYAQEEVKRALDMVDRKYDSTVVVAVSFDQEGDNRLIGPVIEAFYHANTGLMKNNTYLDIKGKRVFLQEYQAPGQDGLGAKFIFPRIVDNKPLLSGLKSGDLRFYAEFPILLGATSSIILNMRFKIADLMYEGVMEY